MTSGPADLKQWFAELKRRRVFRALIGYGIAAFAVAAVEARVGESDAAIEHIRHLLSIPCLLSPGLLRIDPMWAPLRDDPRFRTLSELN